MTVVEVDAVAQAFHDGVANRDAAALASLYHEDGRFLPPNIERARTGRRSRQRCSSCLTWGARSLDVEPVEVREAGDMTIEYGRYTLGIEPEGAAAITDVGQYVGVYETRPDGVTKIALDIINSNSPPAA